MNLYTNRKEHNYYIVEGRRRICAAKCWGFPKIRSIVSDMRDIGYNPYELLLEKIEPGVYESSYSCNFLFKHTGECLVIWLKRGHGSWKWTGEFDEPVVLSSMQNTQGVIKKLCKGVSYSVLVQRKSIFGLTKYLINAKVEIEKEHEELGVWVARADISKLRFPMRLRDIEYKTEYRYGLWREYHLKEYLTPPNYEERL